MYNTERRRAGRRRGGGGGGDDCNYGLIIPFTPITRSPINHRSTLLRPSARPTTSNPFFLPTFLPTAAANSIILLLEMNYARQSTPLFIAWKTASPDENEVPEGNVGYACTEAQVAISCLKPFGLSFSVRHFNSNIS